MSGSPTTTTTASTTNWCQVVDDCSDAGDRNATSAAPEMAPACANKLLCDMPMLHPSAVRANKQMNIKFSNQNNELVPFVATQTLRRKVASFRFRFWFQFALMLTTPRQTPSPSNTSHTALLTLGKRRSHPQITRRQTYD